MTLGAPLAAFLMGLAGGSHCLVMCGGISCALSSAGKTPSWNRISLHHLGRLLSYSCLGAMAGLWSVLGLRVFPELGLVLRLAAASVVVMTGLRLAGFLGTRGTSSAPAIRWGKAIAGYVARLQARGGAVTSVALGALWGLLPCGFLYSALVLAMATGSIAEGGATMAAFGAGTLPWLVAASGVMRWSSIILTQLVWRRVAGLVIATLGVVAAVLALQAGTRRKCCTHPTAVSHATPEGSDTVASFDKKLSLR